MDFGMNLINKTYYHIGGSIKSMYSQNTKLFFDRYKKKKNLIMTLIS